VALARALATGPEPVCDVWLVATGAEERPYTGASDHLGASALVARLERMDRLKDVRVALSLDEVGRGTKFALHSTASAPRENVEKRLLRDGVRWVRDPAGEGNSDHRELARAGAPAAKLGVIDDPCRHTACDTPDRLERRAFTRVLKIVWPLLRTWDRVRLT
jgi:Zn-dependent M28 family amino/carboxypeptidase